MRDTCETRKENMRRSKSAEKTSMPREEKRRVGWQRRVHALQKATTNLSNRSIL
jgi:hypothetical protein